MSEPWSMPWSAPVFTPPPHSWNGVRSVVLPFRPDPAGLAAVLPPGLEPGDGPGLVTMLSYPWGNTGRVHPFNEAVVLVPVCFEGTQGSYVPFIYVTTDEALIAGREIAGWPKKLAEIVWDRDGDRFHGAVTRWGVTILDVDGDLSAPPSDEALQDLLGATGSKPTFNYKLIPGPGSEVEIEEITSTRLEIVPSEAVVGTGRITATSSPDDPVGLLVASTTTPMVAMVSDNTIPLGEVVRRIERHPASPR